MLIVFNAFENKGICFALVHGLEELAQDCIVNRVDQRIVALFFSVRKLYWLRVAFQ